MFNSDMVLYCMKSLILHGVKPKEIVDPNIRTDFNNCRRVYAGTQQNVRKLNYRYFMQRVMVKEDFKLKLKKYSESFCFLK